MYGLDLFSGIGGITKALEGYVTPVAYCENDRYSQGVLLSRMSRGDIPIAPIWDDVSTLHGGDLLIKPEIIYGGFPCQDISVAGHNAKGLDGHRSGLFSQILRLAEEIKPTFLFLENVPNIRTKGLSRVVRELADIGYDCRWCTVSASQIGAPHKRVRFFILAYCHSFRRRDELPAQGINAIKNTERGWSDQKAYLSACRNENEYAPNTGDIRVADGVPHYVDRLRALGNAVVPAQAREAFERLMGVK